MVEGGGRGQCLFLCEVEIFFTSVMEWVGGIWREWVGGIWRRGVNCVPHLSTGNEHARRYGMG